MKKLFCIGIVFCLVTGCIEPFEFEVRTAENVLVVEATITTIDERQIIFLSRASNLENVNVEEAPIYNPNVPFRPVDDTRTNGESNALVKIVDNMGSEFAFSEQNGEGIYVSDLSFAVRSDRSYQLQITTTDNEFYESDFTSPIGGSEIQEIYAERTVNDSGEDGMAIYVDGSDTSGLSDYFRYSYEETYKIVAPNWTSLEFNIIREEQQIIDDNIPILPLVELVPRPNEEQVCYQTESSTAINLISTSSLEKSATNRVLVRFISRNNPILSHRYSILVKQNLQSIDSYSYYQNLQNFTKSESVFSEVQPGFLQGNIKSLKDDDLVIGYFDVVSSTERRLFFSYNDFFPDEKLPPYFFDFNCDRRISPFLGVPNIKIEDPAELSCAQGLIPQIKLGLVEYVAPNDFIRVCEGPYLVTPRICGDCTVLGSNIDPDFWEE